MHSLFSHCLVLIFFLGLSFSSLARQKDTPKTLPPAQTHRLELPSNSNDFIHQVKPLPDSTLLLITMSRFPEHGNKFVEFRKYDSQLKPIWESKQTQLPRTELLFVEEDEAKVSLLFQLTYTSNVFLYQVDRATGAVTASEHYLPSRTSRIFRMAALKGQVYLSVQDFASLHLLHLNPSKPEINYLPAALGMATDLGEFRTDVEGNVLEVLVAAPENTSSRLEIKRLSVAGAVQSTHFVQPQGAGLGDNTLQRSRLTPGDTTQKLVLGGYGYRTSHFAKGIFSSPLHGSPTFYDFSKFNYFFSYLGRKAGERTKAQFVRQLEKEGSFSLRYQVMLHKVVPHPQGYALVGELFNPYRITTQLPHLPKETIRTFPPRGVIKSKEIGYQFNHAFVCVFDKKGNLLWDNAYKIRKINPDLILATAAGVSPNGNVTLVYAFDQYLWYKTLTPNGYSSDEERMQVRVNEKSEKLVTSNSEEVAHWYGPHFVASGFQRIKAQQGPARSVYYLQNMTFE